eukprot:SAG11_NODE_98_length_16927_cov_35.166211_9_plen_137_part_00
MAMAGLAGMGLAPAAATTAGSAAPAAGSGNSMLAMSIAAAAAATAAPIGGAAPAAANVPTTVLRLANAVTDAEVEDAEEYADIIEDMKEECSKFGTVVSLEMPKEGEWALGHKDGLFRNKANKSRPSLHHDDTCYR